MRSPPNTDTAYVPAKVYLELRRQVSILMLVLAIFSPTAMAVSAVAVVMVMRQVRVPAWCVAVCGGALTAGAVGIQVLAGRTRWWWCGIAEIVRGHVLTDVMLGVPLGILAGSLLAMAMHHLARGMEWHRVERRREAVTSHRETVATTRLTAASRQIEGQSPLGVWMGGDAYDWKQGDYVVPPTGKVAAMGLVGESGSGKTVTAMRAAQHWGEQRRQLVVVDFKGTDPDLAPGVIAAYLSTNPDARILAWPAEPLDIWRGDNAEIISKLCGVHQFTEPYYKQAAETAVRLAVNMPSYQPCRSSQEFLRRLMPGLMVSAYEGTPQLMDVSNLMMGNTLPSTSMRFAGFFAALAGRFDTGPALEDIDLAILTIPALSMQADADAIARILISEFGSYCAGRKPRDRQAVLLLDEFSAVGETAAGLVVNLAERVRDANGMIVITSQDAEGLGRTPSERIRLRNACTAGGLLVHRMADPEPLLEGAGTMRVPETTWQQQGEDEEEGEVSRKRMSGTGLVKMSDKMRIRPDDIRRAPTGRVWIINKGRTAKMQVILPEVSDEMMERGKIIAASARGAAVTFTPSVPAPTIPMPAVPPDWTTPFPVVAPSGNPALNQVNGSNGNSHLVPSSNGNGNSHSSGAENPWD